MAKQGIGDRCRRGHLLTNKNTHTIKVHGKDYIRCNMCLTEGRRVKYHTDPTYRSKKLASNRAYYLKNQDKWKSQYR